MTRTSSESYPELVARLLKTVQGDAALEGAVGGDFFAMGKLEHALLEGLGLSPGHFVVDVGCGSGRLAVQLSGIPDLHYLGTDVVSELLAHAEKLAKRDDWEFRKTDGIAIPCEDDRADFVCFFSVLTHLTHEDSFRYLTEARRVLKPGGRIVFSFLEFHIPSHWVVFEKMVNAQETRRYLNQFISRDAIGAWAHHLGLVVQEIHDGDKPHIEFDGELTTANGLVMSGKGFLGQSVAVLGK